jgi:hypothetical protein
MNRCKLCWGTGRVRRDPTSRELTAKALSGRGVTVQADGTVLDFCGCGDGVALRRAVAVNEGIK